MKRKKSKIIINKNFYILLLYYTWHARTHAINRPHVYTHTYTLCLFLLLFKLIMIFKCKTSGELDKIYLLFRNCTDFKLSIDLLFLMSQVCLFKYVLCNPGVNRDIVKQLFSLFSFWNKYVIYENFMKYIIRTNYET